MFYDKFVAICRDRGVTPTAVLRAIGVSPGSLSNWKIGSDPRMATKEKIAEYFNVSVKELMYYGEEDEKVAGDNKEKKSETNNDLELDKYSRALLELYQLLKQEIQY